MNVSYHSPGEKLTQLRTYIDEEQVYSDFIGGLNPPSAIMEKDICSTVCSFVKFDEQKWTPRRDDENKQVTRTIIYNDLEWAMMRLAWALIGGYKRHKGERGYEDDYNRGKDIIEDVNRGMYRD